MDCAALVGGVNSFARCGFYLNPHCPVFFSEGNLTYGAIEDIYDTIILPFPLPKPIHQSIMSSVVLLGCRP